MYAAFKSNRLSSVRQNLYNKGLKFLVRVTLIGTIAGFSCMKDDADKYTRSKAKLDHRERIDYKHRRNKRYTGNSVQVPSQPGAN